MSQIVTSWGKKSNTDVYVGSLPPTVRDEKPIKELFKAYDVVGIFILVSPTGKFFAFVHFNNETDAERSIADFNGFSWNGCILHVKKSDHWLKRLQSTGKINDAPKGYLPAKPCVNSYSDESSGSSVIKSQSSLETPKKNEQLYVVHLIDTVTFFAQRGSTLEQVQKVSTKLQEVCSTLKPADLKTSTAKIFAAKYSQDDTWYRCQIKNKDNFLNKCTVYYIDYGNIEEVDGKHLVQLPADLSQIPPLAIKCRFQNLLSIPQSNANFSQAYAKVRNLFKDKLLTATVTEVEETNTKNFVITEMELEGLKFHEFLVQNGYATPNLSRTSGLITTQWCAPKPFGGTTDTASISSSSSSNFSVMSNKGGPLKKKQIGNKSRNPPVFNKFGGLNSSISGSNQVLPSIIDLRRLETEINCLKIQLSKERGSRSAMEKELNRLKNLNQKPDILTHCDVYSQILDVVKQLESIRNIRQQFPFEQSSNYCRDYIEMAITLIFKGKDEPLPDINTTALKKVELNEQAFKEAQNKILECTDKDLLPELITERNSIQVKLSESLKEFGDFVGTAQFQERFRAVQTVLSELKRIYHPFLQMQAHNSNEIPMKDMVAYYRKLKEDNLPIVQKVQMETDHIHAKLISSFDCLRKALFLEQENLTYKSEAKKGMTFSEDDQQRLIGTLHSARKTFTEEINSCNLESRPDAAVIGIITQMLTKELEKELQEIEQFNLAEKCFKERLEILQPFVNERPKYENLLELRKSIKKTKSKLRHALVDKHDLEECEEDDHGAIAKNKQLLDTLRRQLQEYLVTDSQLMDEASRLYKTTYPELELLYPELEIARYSVFGGLVKPLYQIDFYEFVDNPESVAVDTYYSNLVDTPVIIKEYSINDQTKGIFLENAKEYNNLSSKHLSKIDAIFFSSKGREGYIQQECHMSLFERCKQQSLNTQEIKMVLNGTLEGLNVLHNARLTHNFIHPESIRFPENDLTPVLDVICLTKEGLTDNKFPNVNGLDFRLPGEICPGPASDIYALFCVALWLCAPETQFTSTSYGVLDLSNFDINSKNGDILSTVCETLKTDPLNYLTVNEMLQNQFFGPSDLITGDINEQNSLLDALQEQMVECEELERLCPSVKSEIDIPTNDVQETFIAENYENEETDKIISEMDEDSNEDEIEEDEEEEEPSGEIEGFDTDELLQFQKNLSKGLTEESGQVENEETKQDNEEPFSYSDLPVTRLSPFEQKAENLNPEVD